MDKLSVACRAATSFLAALPCSQNTAEQNHWRATCSPICTHRNLAHNAGSSIGSLHPICCLSLVCGTELYNFLLASDTHVRIVYRETARAVVLGRIRLETRRKLRQSATIDSTRCKPRFALDISSQSYQFRNSRTTDFRSVGTCDHNPCDHLWQLVVAIAPYFLTACDQS